MSTADNLRKQGKTESLLKQLSLKFGPLPENAQQRVQTASIAQLDHFFERVLFATELDRVFADSDGDSR